MGLVIGKASRERGRKQLIRDMMVHYSEFTFLPFSIDLFASLNVLTCKGSLVGLRQPLGGSGSGSEVIGGTANTTAGSVNDETKLSSTDGSSSDNITSSPSSITVLVRVRPLSSREILEETRNVIKVMNQSLVVLLQPLVGKNDFLRQGRYSDKRFAFDAAFDTDASQEDIYERSTKNLIPSILDGYNGCCFCYGSTGAGKVSTKLIVHTHRINAPK